METNVEAAVTQLRKALEHLAADARAQERHLRELGSWPSLDELALEFDDIEGTAGEAARLGRISPEACRRIEALDALLESMSGPGNGNLWSDSALSERAEWVTVRFLARLALDVFEPAHAA